MDLNILGFDFSISKKTPAKIEKKEFVGAYNYGSIADLIEDWVVISVQTFYDLYKKNPDIRQCIRKISSNVGRDWIKLTDNNWDAIDNNVLVDEVFDYLKAPTFQKFKIDLYRNYLLSGEIYITPMRNLKQEIVAFEILDTRSMSKTVNKNGNITGYKQYTKGGAYKLFRVEDVAYFQFESDINNANIGMGLLHWIVRDALSDLEASKTNYMFFENNAVPNSVLMLEDSLSADEMKLAKEQFTQQYKWSANAHKMLIGWGIKDIKTLSMNHKDMDFINQKKLTVEKVSATFGVPKNILWYVDNVNLANGKELRKEYIEWTIRPFEQDFEHILNVLSSKFLPKIFEKYWIEVVWETLDDRIEIEENQRKDIDKGIMTINEARLERWQSELLDENAGKSMVNRSMVLLEDLALDAVLSPNEKSYGGES